MKILILPLLTLLSSCCEKGDDEPSPPEFSFTVVSGALPNPPERFREVSEAVYQLIQQDDDPAFEKYTETIPLSNNTTFELIPIRGGEFTMGSRTQDPKHKPDELPAHRVHVDSFWMAGTETTWAMYQSFLKSHADNIVRDQFGFQLKPPPRQVVDMISGPSQPYLPLHYQPSGGDKQQGSLNQAAVGMSRHAALKFCQWVSAQTGHFYRLPTEAEWEYACRAGTETAYSFGENPNVLSNHAWYYPGPEHPQEVASKAPNPWGLFDMHGNVLEFTLDAYRPYLHHTGTLHNPISFSEKLHHGVARGGDFDSAPGDLRSARRFPDSRVWNNTDPQLPPSIWYYSNGLKVGFRIVRPQKTPSLEEAHLIWNLDSGKFWNG